MKLLFLPFFILLKAQRSGVRGKRSSTTAAKLDVSAKSQKSLEFFKFILSQKSDNLLPNFSVTNIGTVLLRNYVECAEVVNYSFLFLIAFSDCPIPSSHWNSINSVCTLFKILFFSESFNIYPSKTLFLSLGLKTYLTIYLSVEIAINSTGLSCIYKT